MKDGFNLPVITPVIGAQALVGLALLLIVSGQATVIASFIEGLLS